MKKIPCPVCSKRICDSDKKIKIARLSNSNKDKADLVIKCNNCKSTLSVKILKNVVGLIINEPPQSGI